MPVFRVTYLVRLYKEAAPPSPAEFGHLLDKMINAYFEANVDARAEELDATLNVTRVDPRSRSIDTALVTYVVDHHVEATGGPLDARRVEERLRDILGVPQRERTYLDVERLDVHGPLALAED
jgi:hypothetical protein